ncbi:unnamed protein product [Rhizophagus irregularis]|uniref:Ion transport domain-containing protein n=1 Tax=Rhizophagus irregularis TaxID=588596 RepID=A0A915ZGT1_9GLOM|nr:unnamed protein product [Rhizophagus irregularis]
MRNQKLISQYTNGEKDNDHETEVNIQNHKESKIDRIFVSQYTNDYIVTYSKKDNSIVGWSIKGQPQPDEFYKLDELKLNKLNEPSYEIKSFSLYKKKLSLCYREEDGSYKQCLIDLKSKQFYELEHSYSIDVHGQYSIGFLHDDDDDDCPKCKKETHGHLILVSLYDHKIYKYCLKDMPKNATTLKYSEIYDIKIPESLNDQFKYKFCSIYQKKLFLFFQYHKTSILQFDLLTMNLDRQYNSPLDLDSQYSSDSRYEFTTVIMNKDKTLLATEISYSTYIFSMKNGRLITKYSQGGLFSVGSTPIEFVTLKNGFEGLIVHSVYYGMLSQYVFIDPYHPYRNFGDPGKNNIINGTIDDNNVITKLNRKLSIDDDGNVCIKNGLDESEFQQISNNTTYHKIYNSSTFKEIQSMLNETVEKMEKMEIDRVAPADIEFEDGHIIFKKEDECDSIHFVMNNPIVPNNIVPFVKPYTFSYKLINNKQDLVLINVEQIEIFTRSINGITCQYQWNNDEWKNTYKKFRSKNRRYDKNFINEHYRKLINKILKNEFNDSNSSIPLPKFSSEVHEILNNNPLVENIKNDTEALSKFRKDMLDNKINYQQMKAITTSIVDDKELFSKFGSEILKMAIENNYNDIVKKVIDKIIESIQVNSENRGYMELANPSQTNCSYMMTLLPFISSNFLELSKKYPDFAIKYISYTSIILSPYCDFIRNSTNTSLHSYSNVYIKKSNPVNNYFKPISSLWTRSKTDQSSTSQQEVVQTISFIVPFPRICVYKNQKNNGSKKNDRNNNHHETEKTENIEKINHETENNVLHDDHPFNIWNEFLYNPKSLLFCNIDSNHFYNWWNFAAIIDFKWRTFGRIYYFLIWFLYIVYYICYTLASILEPNFITDVQHPWNYFDVGAYSLPIAASICWIINKIQLPNSNTNLFNWFPTSLFAVYKIITGDSGSLSPWAFQDNPLMTFLLFTFTFFTVIYLLNLFIGLLNIAIGDYNKEEEFLLQKAQIIMEIELFYMFPWWKHDKEWFPEWIYYDMPVTEVRKLINAIDNDKTVFNYYLPVISTDLRNLVALVDEIKEEQKNKFIKQLINELQINQKIQFLQTRIENLQISLQDQQVCAQISQELDALRQLLIYTQNQQTDAQDQQTNVRMRLFFLELNKLDQQMKQIDLLFKQMNSQMNPQMNPQNQQMNPQMNL